MGSGLILSQVSDYFYLDDHNASLVTHTIYPDATTRDAETTFGSSADQDHLLMEVEVVVEVIRRSTYHPNRLAGLCR